MSDGVSSSSVAPDRAAEHGRDRELAHAHRLALRARAATRAMEPTPLKTSATVLVTLAATGPSPTASSAG